MKFQSILILTSVAAGTVQAGPPGADKPPKPLKDLDYNQGDAIHDDNQYETDRKSDRSRPLFGYGDGRGQDCTSYNNYPRFSGDEDSVHVPPHCPEGERSQKPDDSDFGWMAVKRQGGGPDGNGDANGRSQNGNVGVDDDGNGRIDDDGNDRIDDDGNGGNRDDNDRNDDNNSRYDDANGPENGDNGRYDDGNGPDDDRNGRDGDDGPRNSAGGQAIPLLGLVSMVAISFAILI